MLGRKPMEPNLNSTEGAQWTWDLDFKRMFLLKSDRTLAKTCWHTEPETQQRVHQS